jgi:DNA-binding NarL/FixJ family response regulator
MAIKLTTIDKEILNFLASGLTIKQVADRLMKRENTIQVHLHRIRAKYKSARKFVNQIDAMRGSKPALRQFLKTREMNDD